LQHHGKAFHIRRYFGQLSWMLLDRHELYLWKPSVDEYSICDNVLMYRLSMTKKKAFGK